MNLTQMSHEVKTHPSIIDFEDISNVSGDEYASVGVFNYGNTWNERTFN